MAKAPETPASEPAFDLRKLMGEFDSNKLMVYRPGFSRTRQRCCYRPFILGCGQTALRRPHASQPPVNDPRRVKAPADHGAL
jgi:hypothetical protein